MAPILSMMPTYFYCRIQKQMEKSKGFGPEPHMDLGNGNYTKWLLWVMARSLCTVEKMVTSILTMLTFFHYHPEQSQRPYTSAKVYYFVKNSLVLNTRYFNAVWLRHALTIAVVIVRTASRNNISAALSLVLGANAPMFYSAIIRGLQGKLGKDFNE